MRYSWQTIHIFLIFYSCPNSSLLLVLFFLRWIVNHAAPTGLSQLILGGVKTRSIMRADFSGVIMQSNPILVWLLCCSFTLWGSGLWLYLLTHLVSMELVPLNTTGDQLIFFSNRRKILAVSTQLEQFRKESLKKKKKNRLERDFNKWPMRCRWNALPTGSWSYCEFVIYPWRMKYLHSFIFYYQWKKGTMANQ